MLLVKNYSLSKLLKFMYIWECVIYLRKFHLNNTGLVLRKQTVYTLMFHISFSSHPITSAVSTLKELASNLKC